MAEEVFAPDPIEDLPNIALLFELENICFQGRQVVFDVLKSMLADKDMELTPVQFSRCCVDTPVEVALPHLLELLERQRVSAEKMVPDILQGIRSSLTDNTPASPPALAGLLQKTLAAGYKLGAVSDLDAEAASQLYTRLGIGDVEDAALVTADTEMGTADAQAWKTAARTLGAVIPSCVVLTTSTRSAHAAVAAGMRCVVIPDCYTAFQDFGGTDRIIDTFDDAAGNDILDILAVHP